MGKKIYVYSEGTITNGAYYLISMADEIYIHEQNSLFLTGFAANFVFYKGLLDKLDMSPVIYRVQKDGKSYRLHILFVLSLRSLLLLHRTRT